MIVTTETIELLDDADRIVSMIKHSDTFNEFMNRRLVLKEDQDAQRLISQFEQKKRDYEDVERFGRYHPDYSRVLKDTRLLKREVDLNESVAKFKVAERKLQALLDQIAETLAFSISTDIVVEKDGAMFTEHSKGCSTGGSCGCSA